MESRPTLSVAIVAAPRMRRHCQAVLTHAAGDRWPSGVAVVSARRLLQRDRPAILLLDAVASPLRALSVLPIIKRMSPATSVILIGRRSTSTEALLEAVRRGAFGHVTEDDLARDLPKAVHTVAGGEPWLPRRLGAAIVAELRAASPRLSLLPRGASL